MGVGGLRRFVRASCSPQRVEARGAAAGAGVRVLVDGTALAFWLQRQHAKAATWRNGGELHSLSVFTRAWVQPLLAVGCSVEACFDAAHHVAAGKEACTLRRRDEQGAAARAVLRGSEGEGELVLPRLAVHAVRQELARCGVLCLSAAALDAEADPLLARRARAAASAAPGALALVLTNDSDLLLFAGVEHVCFLDDIAVCADGDVVFRAVEQAQVAGALLPVRLARAQPPLRTAALAAVACLAGTDYSDPGALQCWHGALAAAPLRGHSRRRTRSKSNANRNWNGSGGLSQQAVLEQAAALVSAACAALPADAAQPDSAAQLLQRVAAALPVAPQQRVELDKDLAATFSRYCAADSDAPPLRALDEWWWSRPALEEAFLAHDGTPKGAFELLATLRQLLRDLGGPGSTGTSSSTNTSGAPVVERGPCSASSLQRWSARGSAASQPAPAMQRALAVLDKVPASAASEVATAIVSLASACMHLGLCCEPGRRESSQDKGCCERCIAAWERDALASALGRGLGLVASAGAGACASASGERAGAALPPRTTPGVPPMSAEQRRRFLSLVNLVQAVVDDLIEIHGIELDVRMFEGEELRAAYDYGRSRVN
jgi:hypothetical protein